MGRAKLSLVVVLIAVVALAVAATSALSRTSSPARAGSSLIKGDEVGYFGSANVAHQVSVFVYSSARPGPATHVSVCVKGTCKAALGRKAPTGWYYSASFATSPLPMGAPVTYSAVVTSAGHRASTKVTKGLLCMHNSGSTPQAS